MNCECEIDVNDDHPITPTTKKRAAKHLCIVGFKANFKKGPKCKGKNCFSEITYQWSLTPTDPSNQFTRFNADQQECVVTGNGEFQLKVEVTLRCFEAEDAESDDDDDQSVGIEMETDSSKASASKIFKIHV